MISGGSQTLTDIEVALEAAAVGAAIVRASFRAESRRIRKAGIDFATEVDLESERAIRSVLTAHRPDDLVDGEEYGPSGPDRATRRWLIDPLCGTLNYSAGTPLAAVNVALLSQAGPLVAVSADPVAGETFWSDGQRTGLEAVDGGGTLVPSARSGLVDVNCDAHSDPNFFGPQLIADEAFRAAFGPRVLSTTLAVAWVAAGRRAGYVSDGLALHRDIHFAAGIALCQAAGCVVTDLEGRELEGGRGLIAAADQATHTKLVILVRPHLENRASLEA